jgi:signal transduction histidine kinase
MCEATFARRGITVVREVDDVPQLATDRHKLLQILINLISNAKHALEASGGDDRRLIVRAHATETSVVVAVADTGVGIPPESFAKIFQRGFTTKSGGHGFGLHASANAARELGGRLAAASDGPGRGATFTLELPIRRTGSHDRN